MRAMSSRGLDKVEEICLNSTRPKLAKPTLPQTAVLADRGFMIGVKKVDITVEIIGFGRIGPGPEVMHIELVGSDCASWNLRRKRRTHF